MSHVMGSVPLDTFFEHVFLSREMDGNIRPFTPIGGSDERQYCSPGFNLPIGQIARRVYAEYDEYHNSLDNKEFMTIEAIQKSVDELELILKSFEKDGYYINQSPYGEVKLDQHNLYPDMNSPSNRSYSSNNKMDGRLHLNQVLTILNYADGHHRLSEIAEKCDLQVKQEELNSQMLIDWIRNLNVEQLISYGVHKLSPEIITICPDYAWNIHGGLSPWYRGTATLFWPFYFMKPNWAGMTIHKLSNEIDGGDIIHQSIPELKRGDGIHDVACRAVSQAAIDLVKILRLRQAGHTFKGTPQKNGGKLFMNSDWEPQTLRVVYQLFQNDLVDQFIDGKVVSNPPNLVRAF